MDAWSAFWATAVRLFRLGGPVLGFVALCVLAASALGAGVGWAVSRVRRRRG